MPKLPFIEGSLLRVALMLAAAAVSASAQTTAVKELGPDVLPLGRGKPVLVNFWATWCGPCKYEFPELAAIDREFRDKGLVTVVVSLDRPSFADRQIPEFLRQSDAEMPSFVLDFWTRAERNRAIRRAIPVYRAMIPLTVLFDAEGRIVLHRNGVFDQKDLRMRIEKELAKQPAPPPVPGPSKGSR